ncbi:MAG: hypothetical protein ABI870_00675 [Rhodanobacter sp.]
MASSVYEGDDWGLEGTAKWWWKYVMPNPEIFYSQILAEAARLRSADPEPAPWLQRASGEVMEALAMFHAAARMGEREGSARLKHEAFARLSRAVASLGSEGGFIGIDQTGPIGPRTHANAGESRAS